jgi:hypothetical protein
MIAQHPYIAYKMEMQRLTSGKEYSKSKWSGKTQKNSKTSNEYQLNI